jgi:hypothetical protein
VSILWFCIRPEYIDISVSALRDTAKGTKRSFRGPVPKAGVNGVKGVLGVEIYRPLHLGQRTGSSADEEEIGRKPFVFPARRG